jgi:hypothetical protein
VPEVALTPPNLRSGEADGRFALDSVDDGAAMRVAMRTLLPVCLVAVVAAMTGTVAIARQASATSARTCPAKWSVVSAPGPGGLQGVSAVSSNDVWAVGSQPPANHPLVEHWDGASWTISPSPAVSRGLLNAVNAVSSSDVWAVGANGSGTLAEHWDGVRWTIVPSPSPGNVYNQLYGVSGTGASDQWAAGYGQNLVSPNKYVGNVLIEHWNGIAWQTVPVPQIDAQLYSIRAVTVSNAWAVGYSGLPGNQELVLHWDGHSWTQVTAAPNDNVLYGLNQGGLRLHWAAGQYAPPGVGNAQVLHLVKKSSSWAWEAVPTQIPTQGSSGLLSVVQVSSTNVWAVGNAASPNPSGVSSLIEHWNGSQFTIDPSGSVNGGDLFSIASAGSRPKVLWAVGLENSNTPLIMNRCATPS